MARAYGRSSSAGSSNPTQKVSSGWPAARIAMAVTRLESSPPLTMDPTGTSLTRRRWVAAYSSASTSLTAAPLVCSTIGTTGVGIDDLLTAVGQHRDHQLAAGGADDRRQQRAEVAVQAVVLERVQAALASADGQALLAAAATEVAAGDTDHHRAAVALLAWLGRAR